MTEPAPARLIVRWPCSVCGWAGVAPLPTDRPWWESLKPVALTIMESHIRFHVDSLDRELYELTEEA